MNSYLSKLILLFLLFFRRVFKLLNHLIVMKIILLNGHGISLWVDSAKLHVKDGSFTMEEEPQHYVFNPKRVDIEHVVIYGQDGNITLDAIRWMVKHNIQVSFLNWDGKLLTSMLPPESVEVKTKFAQYNMYNDFPKRLSIAKRFIAAKFARTQLVLDWLKERYPEINNDFSSESQYFRNIRSISDILMCEGRVARQYWNEFSKIVPKEYEFEGRKTLQHPRAAGDMANVMLNYGYTLLEAEILRAINSVGLDCHIGFLHEKCMGKNSLAYDFQELFRFLVDLTVIDLIETKAMQKKDFIRTENYNLRLRPTGARKVTETFNKQMNKMVTYYNKQCSWSYVILLKVRELAAYVNGKSRDLDFLTPDVTLNRVDSEELRQKIISITYAQWKKLGFSKGTLHYMKKNAMSDKPFTLNKHVRERLNSLA